MPADRRAELAEIPDYEPTGCSFISHEAADLARPRVAALKTAGAAILCWTIRSPEAEAEARKMAGELDTPSTTLRVHPEIAKALKTREAHLIEELERATHKNAVIQSDATLHFEQYDIY